MVRGGRSIVSSSVLRERTFSENRKGIEEKQWTS